MSDLAQQPRRLRWFQVQLRTVLLLTVIAALALAQFVTTRRATTLHESNSRLVTENAKLRAEAGYLEVSDPRKAYVLRLQDADELTWRWKVWLPQGRWRLGGRVTQIQRVGAPDSGNIGPFAGGREVMVLATIRKGAEGSWRFRVELDSANFGSSLPEDHRLIAEAPMVSRTSDIAGDKQQQAFDPAHAIVLIQLIADEIVIGANGLPESRPSHDDNDGILIWLRREP